MTGPHTRADMARAIAEIWTRSTEITRSRVDAIEAAATALLESGLTPEQRGISCRAAHSLAGSAGSFGFARASALAREAEVLLMGDAPIASGSVLRLANVTVELRAEIERAITPAAPDPEQDQAPRPAAEHPTGSATDFTTDVLVVDDDPVLTGLLEHALAAKGYASVVMDDGAEAVRALCAAPPAVIPAVILLDISLPGMDGFGVLRALAGAGVLQRSRVIVLTARTLESEVVQALELGAHDHMVKPFSVPVLMQRVRLAMQSLSTK